MRSETKGELLEMRSEIRTITELLLEGRKK
jgi:hypothetical protein